MIFLLIKDGLVEHCIAANSIEDVTAYYPDHQILEQVGSASVGWKYSNGVFVAPAGTVGYSTRITRLAFLNRFTDQEAITIDLASIGATPEAAMMRRSQKKIDAASFIDLSDEATIIGVNTLEAIGLISQGRSSQILSLETSPNELYLGV